MATAAALILEYKQERLDLISAFHPEPAEKTLRLLHRLQLGLNKHLAPSAP